MSLPQDTKTKDIPLDQIILGDCEQEMKKLPENSIDLIATDPPYGLTSTSQLSDAKSSGGFMGRSWDRSVPSVSVWRECLRVMKPGAFAFVMCIPRQDCLARMIVNLSDAGFDVSFTSLYHVFGSGFPKGENTSKAADKRLGKERPVIPATGGLAGGSGNSVGSFTGVCVDPTPISDEAKRLDGSYAGYSPKPALEVILVAMKPLSESTYLAQAMKTGKGITWLDRVRVPFAGKGDIPKPTDCVDFDDYDGSMMNKSNLKDGTEKASRTDWLWDGNPRGRFPANLVVSDSVLDDGKERRAERVDGSTMPDGGYGGFKPLPTIRGYEDSGDFSRYFSLDSWWAERVRNLPESVRRTFPFLIVPKPSPGERDEGLDDFEPRQKWRDGGGGTAISARDAVRVKNVHPTVKSIALMMYLLELGSKPGDLVLDPFMGSGTTALAAKILCRHWVGFEIVPDYLKIARERVGNKYYDNFTVMEGMF